MQAKLIWGVLIDQDGSLKIAEDEETIQTMLADRTLPALIGLLESTAARLTLAFRSSRPN